MTETTDLVESDLLPCPFCGGGAELDTRRAYRWLSAPGGLSDEVAIYCLKCGAEICEDPDDVDLSREQVTDDLIERWNARHG